MAKSAAPPTQLKDMDRDGLDKVQSFLMGMNIFVLF
jgi:hypothetical protein